MLPTWLISIILLGIIIYLGYLYFTWNYNHWSKLNVFGPKPKIFTGTFPRSFSQKQNQIYDFNDIYNKYKKDFKFVGVYMMRNPELLILDPSLGRDVYVKYFKNFHDNAAAEWIDIKKDKILSHNPFILRGEAWKEKRAEITPALTTSRIKASFPIMQQVGGKMINYIKALVKASESQTTTLECKELASRFTIETVSDCIYGIEAKAFGKGNSVIFEQAKVLLKDFLSAFFYLMAASVIPFVRRFYTVSFFSKSSQTFFTSLMNQAIDLRLQSKTDRADFLNYLLALREKKGLTDLQMAGHTMSFFFDGFETSSTLICNCLLFLARHQECQEKLRKEIEKNLDQNGVLSFEKLHELEYLDLCIHETLRIFPPGLISQKLCNEPVEFENYDGKSVTIPAGTVVHIPLYCYHNDEQFYKDADKFKPERFADGAGKDYHEKGIFMPFGDGPRICLGMRFAMAQSKTAITEIIKNFKITVNPKTRKDNFMEASFLPLLKGGVWVDFKEIV